MKRRGCIDCRLIEPQAGQWAGNVCPACTESRARRAERQPEPPAPTKPQVEDATVRRLTGYLRTVHEGLPTIWREIDARREKREWPPYVYLPARHFPAEVEANSALPALAAWRPTQGIYRFDPDVLPALCDTPVGALPIEVLYALPEWCVYIECAAMGYPHPNSGQPILGYFVWLDHDRAGKIDRLYFGLDDGRYISTVAPVTLRAGTLSEAIERSIQDFVRAGLEIKAARPEDRQRDPATVLRESAEQIPYLIGPVLYLCSTNAEIRTRKEGMRPSRPQATKTKAGMRTFAPGQPIPWEVGWRIGAAIRAAREQGYRRPGDGTHASPRPHIRRAHWHSFWTGPKARVGVARDAERKLALKWLPPIAVNVEEGVETIPTVHPVEAQRGT